ncbi:hypothetical protein BKA82DRAFT_750658 [Pisolithus tinctorius]|uniref:Uncharacterized protein n=1 Tax=Pisolithus tinctorius Marx 270 TaxID=870435 RepID=A0A0C3PST9_PISTI|nr:hypothetical protein BKA82DRAFT_750658 [Pisolithus tinctorius]KIO12241.1 hypothetical protein M404DRAFT_750658 [Pisolithus tinctorius Marx 270]
MAENHSRILDDQARLSEQLQLLNQFEYSDLEIPDVQQHWKQDRETRITARLLDTIAVALTTGKPGEVFAATFDTRNGLRLVLAKNEDVTDEDDRAVREFFQAIIAPETTEAYDVFPFLFSRCAENIAKRIEMIGRAVFGFSYVLDEAYRDYYPSASIEEEFPHSTAYRNIKYGGYQLPSLQTVLRDLLTDITKLVQKFNLQNLSATPNLYAVFARLVVTAATFNSSRFLRRLTDFPSSMNLDWSLQTGPLKRHLAEVLQYALGVDKLIKHAKLHFPNGIQHRWVDAFQGIGATMLNLDDSYVKPISRVLGCSDVSEETLAKLCRKSPNMGEMWRRSRSVTIRLHAEIRILLYLSNPVDASDHCQQKPIGCSEQTCLCCTLWIRAYNQEFGTNWLASASNGKPCATWALPGCSFAHALEKGGRSVIDEAVVEGIEERLTRTLQSLLSEECESSDSDSDWGLECEYVMSEEMKALVAKRHQDARKRVQV